MFKYEKGINQISISRLLKVIEVLSLSLDYFLEDIKLLELDKKTPDDQNIFNNFMQIKDKACQKVLSDLIKLLSKKL